MDSTTRALVATAFNNEELDLGVDRHQCDEEFVVRVSGFFGWLFRDDGDHEFDHTLVSTFRTEP